MSAASQAAASPPGYPALGDRVIEPISGFTGIVTGVCAYISGQLRYAIQPETTKDGTFSAPVYLDLGEIRLVTQGVHAPQPTVPSPTA